MDNDNPFNPFIVNPAASKTDLYDAMSLRLEQIQSMATMAIPFDGGAPIQTVSADAQEAYLTVIHDKATDIEKLLDAYRRSEQLPTA